MSEFEHVPVSRLIANARNARVHPRAQIQKLVSSIKRFQFLIPVLIDEANNIIAGHARVQAATQLGMETVPCRRVTHLSKDEIRAYAIADNQIALKAGWDREILAEEFIELRDAGFEIELMGFEIAEIDQIIDLAAEAKGKEDREGDIPTLRAEPVARLGEVWALGAHRLLCGDACAAGSYRVLMGNELAQMVFTDPPYNVKIDQFVGGKGKIKHREFVQAAGEMTEERFTAFLTSALEWCARYSIDGAILFACMDWRHIRELMDAGDAVGLELKNIIAWVKDNGGMGTFYRSRHELVFAFKNGTAAHINNFELGQWGRSRTNVWEYPGVNTMRAGRLEELGMHPTVKPLPLVADALKDCSKPKGIILDPFAGSGTTLIAAENTGRVARVMELDPLYCDVIIRRWQNYTGRHAILGDSDVTFEQIEHTFVGA